MSDADLQLTGLAVFAVILFIVGGWVLVQYRDSPEKREKRRRLNVSLHGRLADGMVTDLAEDLIYYSYAVAGVEYQASQDVSQLGGYLPAERDRLIGPVTLKYAPRNPANSIVICEVWSGTRVNNKENVSQ
jgi:hypothetical protein